MGFGDLGFAIHDHGGPPGAPLFAWLHANGCASRSYGPFIRCLTPHWRVVALDLPSHGDSPLARETSLVLPRLAEALRASLAELRSRHGSPGIVGGHSLGACLWLASGDLAVRAVFVEMAVYPPLDHPNRDEADALTLERVSRIPGRRAIFGQPADLARSLGQSPAFAGIPWPALLEHCEAVLRLRPDGQHELRCPPSHEARLYAVVASDWAYNALPQFTSPALVVGAGTNHPGASWATRMQRTVAARMPHATYCEIAEAGHMLPLEAPERLAEAILSWGGTAP